jgi:hypothetical protein
VLKLFTAVHEHGELAALDVDLEEIDADVTSASSFSLKPMCWPSAGRKARELALVSPAYEPSFEPIGVVDSIFSKLEESYNLQGS